MPDVIDLEQVLNAALARHEAGQLDLAEAGYRTVLRHDPHEPDALNLLAVILQERDDIDGSIALLTRALAIDPDFPEALANIARAHRLAGAPVAATDAARRAIALDPDLPAAHLQLGRALFDMGDDAGAAEALRRATALAPQSVDALVPLGMALIRLKDPRAADGPLTAALALNPRHWLAQRSISRPHSPISHALIAPPAMPGPRSRRPGARWKSTQPCPMPKCNSASRCSCNRTMAGAVEVLRRATAMAPEFD